MSATTPEAESTALASGASEATDADPAEGVRWELSDLYAGPEDPALEADLRDALERARTLAERTRGRVAELGAEELASTLDALEAALEPVARAAAFSELLFASDTGKAEHGALLQRVQERATQVRTELLFFELEWLAVPDERAEALLAEPVLAGRRHLLRSLRRYRPYVLSEAEERILEERANTGKRAFTRLFDEILSGLRFRVELEGGARDLAEEETLALLHEGDREVRRAAARGLTEGLQANASTLRFLFNTLVHDKAVEDRLRGYADPMDERNLANEIDGASVEALMGACESRHPLVERYYRTKARLLGLERLYEWDRYAPLPEARASRSFEEARRVVLDAYADFAPEMAEVAGRFFERRWIDAELRPGKRGGAFSAPTVPSAHPYVMLSYTGQLRDVMTVAHELGHGVHQYLARERGLFEQNTPLTTAETASVFGEMLVFRRLLREESDPRTRLALLCGKLEDAFATVFRQVVMTRFEQRLHAARREEGELPVERMNELWMEVNRPMHGDAVELTRDYAWWWLYIPHFVHTPFYCYAYAYGELLVLALLRRYDREGADFVPRYLDMLRAGGSESPAELVGRVGLDVTDPGFWDGGLAVLEEMVEEVEALAVHANRANGG